jgi:ketosteroid isomerase-like protein
MIDRAWAESFAREWAAQWNARDVEAVLAHFSDDVVFRSPLIAKVLGEGHHSVSGLPALRDYWTKALAAAGDIRFEILRVAVGGDALTIHYRNQRGQEVAETLVFGENGKANEGIVTHF